MPKSILSSPKIATVSGAPYSPGTKAGNLVFVAGMLALDATARSLAPEISPLKRGRCSKTSRRSSKPAAAG